MGVQVHSFIYQHNSSSWPSVRCLFWLPLLPVLMPMGTEMTTTAMGDTARATEAMATTLAMEATARAMEVAMEDMADMERATITATGTAAMAAMARATTTATGMAAMARAMEATDMEARATEDTAMEAM